MDTKIEQPDGKDNGNKLTDTQKLSADAKLRIQGLEKDIAAAEEVKADMIVDAGQAIKAGDMDAADKARRIANEADQASSYLQREKMQVETSLNEAEKAVQETETAVPTTVNPQEEIPDPGDRSMTSASYVEAKEGDRNVEDGMVETNFELHPQGPEGKMSGR